MTSTLTLRRGERKLSYWPFFFPGDPLALQIRANSGTWQTFPAAPGYIPAVPIYGAVWHQIWFAAPDVDISAMGAHPIDTIVITTTSFIDIRLTDYPVIEVDQVGKVILTT